MQGRCEAISGLLSPRTIVALRSEQSQGGCKKVQAKFDIVHTHLSSSSDMYLFPLTAHLGTPHVTTLHSVFPFDRDALSNRTGDADSFYIQWAPFLPMVAISESARQNVPYPLNFVGVVHHGLYMQDFQSVKGRIGDNFVWLGRFMPEKGAHLAIEAAKRAQVPLVLAGIIDRHCKVSMDYFEQMIKPHIGKDHIKVYWARKYATEE